jgi:hypothetical protein
MGCYAPRQQEPGITAHLIPFLRAFSHFSSFISLSQLIKLLKFEEYSIGLSLRLLQTILFITLSQLIKPG